MRLEIGADRNQIAALMNATCVERHAATLSHGRQRVFLVLMHDHSVSGAPATCMLIDIYRRTVASVRMAFDSLLFDGTTVFAGELVMGANDRMLFLVEDILLLRGAALETDLQMRHDTVISIMKDGRTRDTSYDDLHVVVKRFCHLHDLSPLLDLIPGLSYSTGYITVRPTAACSPWFDISLPTHISLQSPKLKIARPFRNPPTDSNYCTLTAAGPKKASRPRILEVRRTDLPDVYEILDRRWSIACLPTLLASHFMRHKFAGKCQSNQQSLRMWCTFNVAFQKWEPSVEDSFSSAGVTEDGGVSIVIPTTQAGATTKCIDD